MTYGKDLAALLILATAVGASDQKAVPALEADLKTLEGEWVPLKGKASGDVRLRFSHFARNGNTTLRVSVMKKGRTSSGYYTASTQIRLEEPSGQRFFAILTGAKGKELCRVPYRVQGDELVLDNAKAQFPDLLQEKGTEVNLKGRWLRRAAQAGPQTMAIVKAFYDRGNHFYGKQVYDEAVEDYTQAIALHPRFVDGYVERGWAYLAAKAYENAHRDFVQAMWLEGKNARALNSLAWFLATCPEENTRDGKRALELAKKACELTQWKNPSMLDTLAAAYAETGQYADAAKWEQKALESPDFPREDVAGARRRLKLYQANKPFRLEK
jgi:tetratricopeptide (TPR) repeat protein